MTAVRLFDALATPEALGLHRQDDGKAAGLAQLAEKLVEASLDEVRRIRQYEQQFVFGAQRPPDADLAARRSVWEMLATWADDAQQVLARAKSVARTNTAPVPGTDQLDDAIGQVRARLTVTPERVLAAKEQVRQGQFVPQRSCGMSYTPGFGPDAQSQFRALDPNGQEVALDELDRPAASSPSGDEYVGEVVIEEAGVRRNVFVHVTIDHVRSIVTLVGVGCVERPAGYGR